MNAPLYIDILDQTLLPFIREVFPAKHWFMQDNDPLVQQQQLSWKSTV